MSCRDLSQTLWRKIKQCFWGKKYYSLDEYDDAIFSEETENKIY
jgi:hypothetical protein